MIALIRSEPTPSLQGKFSRVFLGVLAGRAGGVCGSLPSPSHRVSAALKKSSVVGPGLLWGVQGFGWEFSPRNRELVTQGKRRVALREGPCPCSPLSQLSVSAGSQGQGGCSQRGMVTSDWCWMCCGSLRASLGCPVIPEVVTQALGRSPVLWEVLSVLGFSCHLYFFCLFQGREGSISILVTGAQSHGVFQALCHDLLHGCRRR